MKDILLLYNNSMPHTAIMNQLKLMDLHWETLPIPYSSDLLSDYHLYLFGLLKDKLGGHRLETYKEVKELVTQLKNLARYYSSYYFFSVKGLKCFQICGENM